MFPRIHLHLGDYLRRTLHLRAAHHGAFLLLIFYYWANGELPQEDEQLATIACMDTREWKKNKPVLQKMFEPGWRLSWLEADLKDAADSYARRSKAGKAGNEKRWDANRHAHSDRHAFAGDSPDDRNAIANGSLPPAACRSEEPEQDRTHFEEGDGSERQSGSRIISLRRERG